MKQIRFLLAVLTAFVFTARAWAQTEERYAEVSTDGKTLTFYLDSFRSTRTGTTYDIPWGNGDPGWTTGPYSSTITTARFDGLFGEGDVLTSTKAMFKNLTSLTVIEGLEKLYTGEVTNMESMFENCSQLKQLDMIDFNIAAVTNMNRMFYSCSSLESICCNEDWSMGNKVTTSTDMFAGCTNLKGAVSYASYKSNDISFANPTTGYFTGKVEPYAILSDEGTVLISITTQIDQRARKLGANRLGFLGIKRMMIFGIFIQDGVGGTSLTLSQSISTRLLRSITA